MNILINSIAVVILTCLPKGLSLICDFETDLCGWRQDSSDQFDWRRSQGPTVARVNGRDNWGINEDHTLQTMDGWFIHADLESPSEGAMARIQTHTFSLAEGMLLTFWFHMYVRLSSGSGFALNVFLVENNGDETLLFQQDAVTYEDEWTCAEIELPSCIANCTIVFEAVKGDFRYMEIGLDDVSIVEMPPTTPPTFNPADCTFEFDLCNFQQDVEDDFDWLLHTGTTPSGATGPSNDHTYGNIGNGTYLYIEASAPRIEGDKARLISEVFPGHRDGDYTSLSFYNHMHGTSMGTMNVYIIGNNDTEVLIWSKTGNQGLTYGDHWLYTEHHINVTYSFRVAIEGVIGPSYLGDMAIDDVSITRVVTQQHITTAVYPTSDDMLSSAAPSTTMETIIPSSAATTDWTDWFDVGRGKTSQTDIMGTELENLISTPVTFSTVTLVHKLMTTTPVLETSATLQSESIIEVKTKNSLGSTLFARLTSITLPSSMTTPNFTPSRDSPTARSRDSPTTSSRDTPIAPSRYSTTTTSRDSTTAADQTSTINTNGNLSDKTTVVESKTDQYTTAGNVFPATITTTSHLPMDVTNSHTHEDTMTVSFRYPEIQENTTEPINSVYKDNTHITLAILATIGGILGVCVIAALGYLISRMFVRNKVRPHQSVKSCFQPNSEKPVQDIKDRDRLVKANSFLRDFKKSKRQFLKWSSSNHEMTIVSI